MGERPRYTKLLGGAVDGVKRSEIPQIVTNLLAARSKELKITIRPEVRPDSPYYTVAWQYLTYDPAAEDWQGLNEEDDE